ncbi:MAG TPA: hypothetical protein VF622_08295, partial [Segetibacter sp.]
MKGIFLTLLTCIVFYSAQSQLSFVDLQKSYPRVASAIKQKEDTLRQQFILAGLQWPVKQM